MQLFHHTDTTDPAVAMGIHKMGCDIGRLPITPRAANHWKLGSATTQLKKQGKGTNCADCMYFIIGLKYRNSFTAFSSTTLRVLESPP
jgi:hypothetical protein